MRYTYLYILTLLMGASSANAQDSIERTEKMNVSIGSLTLSSVKVDEIKFPPSKKAPMHKHSCPVVGQIVKGVCLLQVQGEDPRILHEGDIFYEPADVPILHFDNYSETEIMEFMAYYLANGQGALTEILPAEKR
ncbi:MAG: cupin domain-containing protein [Chitinophagaceae bacterium]|nr:cupin domain-containing protein [Chitinophagaceae bacterium]